MNPRRAVGLILVVFVSGATGWKIALLQRSSILCSEHSSAQRGFLQTPTQRFRPNEHLHPPHHDRTQLWVTPSEKSQEEVPTSETVDHALGVGSNATAFEQARPFPRVGDIVEYTGTWKSDMSFGEIRQLQQVGQTGQWRAYVLSLEEIGENEYARDKYRRSKAEDVSTLRPVRAFFVRSINGFKVMMNAKTGGPRYLSDGYELRGFELPKPKQTEQFSADLESYQALKARLVIDTASFGIFSALLTALFFGVDQAVLVALGALSAVAYVILLERATDDVGSGKRDALTKLRGDARFAMPVILVGLLALKNYLQDPGSVAPLKLVSKEEFTCAIGGFVASSRLPLLFRELRASIKGEDILNILPGSIGQGRQMLNTMGRSDSPGVAASVGSTQQATTTVFMVSSPRVLDRNDLVDQIMREDHRLVAPVWCTTRPLRQAEVADEKLTSLGQMRFEDVDRRGGFLYTYEDERGESYGLRLEDILAVAEKGKVCIINADRGLVEALIGVSNLLLVGVWVSVNSFDVLKDYARNLLTKRGAPEDEMRLESDVRAFVREAISDIDFAITSRAFDFTIIRNSSKDGDAIDTLRRAVEFAASS